MSSLTGYLTSDGFDLSSVFHSKTNFNFNNAITPQSGIIGPPNITYTPGMIGYVQPFSVTTSKSLTSGTIYNLTSFTLNIGMYLCSVYGYNTYSDAGTLTNFNLGISSTTANQSADGFWVPILNSVLLPTSTFQFIIGNTMQPLLVTTSKTYYFIQQIKTSGITTLINSPTAGQSFANIVRIA